MWGVEFGISATVRWRWQSLWHLMLRRHCARKQMPAKRGRRKKGEGEPKDGEDKAPSARRGRKTNKEGDKKETGETKEKEEGRRRAKRKKRKNSINTKKKDQEERKETEGGWEALSKENPKGQVLRIIAPMSQRMNMKRRRKQWNARNSAKCANEKHGSETGQSDARAEVPTPVDETGGANDFSPAGCKACKFSAKGCKECIEAEPKKYGCSRCRYAALGCRTCKNPGFKPRKKRN